MGGVVAVPFASPLNGLTLFAGTPPHVVVVGAGAFGGWTALHLRRMGARVTLLDAWGPGHTRASSGGETRVIRAIYGPDRVYVELVKRSYELWEALDPSLYVETGTLWMHRGDDAYVRSSAPALHDLGFPLEQIPMADAAKRYPQISFKGVQSVWLEHRAGALYAARGCVTVRDAFVKAGGVYRTGHATPGVLKDGAMPSLRLDDGTTLAADAFVFACGPWLGKVFPEVIGERVHPTRQEVFYFGSPEGSERYGPAQLPIWIDFGERIFYGIPDLGGRGFKISDDTRGESFDPTSGDRTPSPAAIARARGLLAERFPELATAPLLKAEVCQYENSPDGNLIVDRHPAAKNVWLLGGGSGHGYKLSPAVGELTANALLHGKDVPKLFTLARLREAVKTETQFERKD
ncbi:MAG: FAD-dependent oxidoreductase [Acidobacteriota bacterium]